jgi:NSS family neurotransmitter:Na+ symporter
MFEVVGESLMHKFPKLKRIPMLILLCVICFGIGVNMEPIFKWGPWMDFISIYIIPIGATLGAISWFWIMKKEDLLNEINLGAKKKQGDLWYNMGKYVYVPFAAILCIVALSMKVAF